MATNLKLDDALVEEAVRLSGVRTKRDAVNLALYEFVNKRKQRDILKLRGTIDYDPDYDYKEQRKRA
jgi:Arc/MetJ family transcription regulator